MRKIVMFVCEKCNATFSTEAASRKHEENCGKGPELVEISLSVDHIDGALIDSAVTIGEYGEDNTILVCDRSDDDGYPLEREIKLMDPEVEDIYMDGYDFTIWCTTDQEPEAERKLREYAETVLKSQAEHLSKMLESLEKLH